MFLTCLFLYSLLPQNQLMYLNETKEKKKVLLNLQYILAFLQAGPGTIIMASGVQDFNRTESDRLNEIKGHLEIALLEKHFLRKYKMLCREGWFRASEIMFLSL